MYQRGCHVMLSLVCERVVPTACVRAAFAMASQTYTPRVAPEPEKAPILVEAGDDVGEQRADKRTADTFRSTSMVAVRAPNVAVAHRPPVVHRHTDRSP